MMCGFAAEECMILVEERTVDWLFFMSCMEAGGGISSMRQKCDRAGQRILHAKGDANAPWLRQCFGVRQCSRCRAAFRAEGPRILLRFSECRHIRRLIALTSACPNCARARQAKNARS